MNKNRTLALALLSLTLTASPLAFAADAKIMFRFVKTAGDVMPLSGIVFDPGIIYVGDAVDQDAKLTKSGNGAIIWSSTGDLPDGLSLSSAGRLHGRASRAGNYGPISLVATDSLNQATNSSDISISVFALPAASDIVTNIPVHQPRTIPLQVTGGGGGMAAAIKSGSLPDGMTLSGLNITGTPSRADRYEAVIEFSDRNGRKTSAEVHLEVLNDLEIEASFPDAYVGAAYNGGFMASGGSGAFAWTLNSAQIPGLTFGTSTGLFTGTPTEPGSYPVSATLFDHPQSMNASGALSVFDQPVLSSHVYPDAYKDVSYSSSAPSASGGKAPVAWTASGLPAGFSVSSTNGSISASAAALETLAANSSVNFSLRLEDANGRYASNNYSFAVREVPQIASTSLPQGFVGVPYSAPNLTATGGKGPFTWYVSGGSLPSGVSLSSSGAFAGSPTTQGSASFTVGARDANGRVATQSMAITTNADISVASTIPSAMTTRSAVTGAVSASGGKAPYSYAVTAGSLPNGVNLNSTTGVISGAPTTVGSSTVTITAKDANNRSASVASTINVAAGTVVASLSGGNGVVSLQGLFSAADWSDANVNKSVTLAAGQVRGTTGNAAPVSIGAAWAGGLTFTINGELQGGAGPANGGVGGNGFNANTLSVTNQKINLVVNGAIRAGGGGGGRGGQGGTGGNGVVENIENSGEQFNDNYVTNYTFTYAPSTNTTEMNWNWNFMNNSGEANVRLVGQHTVINYNGATYYRGAYVKTTNMFGDVHMYRVTKTRVAGTTPTWGGAGGAGGAGGQGQGYSSPLTGGAPGAGGLAGGQNAGAGGAGGWGGTGGGWGAQGNPGAQGAAGGWGNGTGWGPAGAGGAVGGAAGFGIQNPANVNRTGAGAVQGR